ncbi:MAG TPA: glycoside hydrolase family 10, partial [Candidatus Polarisedimenticolia bacterium]|nr:glycoside hydrolase family 10 [Candidatus Polarisedimenticolia bacterium]
AVTGCSYAGKMALFAGAMDERIALTIAQESGGGGANSWRYNHTETAGSVEDIDNTDYHWFSAARMQQFAGNNVSFLPEDHHMLDALVAPRPLFVSGNPGYTWLGNPSCYVCCRAVEQIYGTFGVPDRFGYNIQGGHAHCSTTASIDSEMAAFVNRFLLDQTNVNTLIRDYDSTYSTIDYASWYSWWGVANYAVMLEPECGTVGANWSVFGNATTSHGKYVTAASGFSSPTNPPPDATGWISMPFTVNTNATFNLVGRVSCPSPGSDSFWVKVDDGGNWGLCDGLITSGYQWKLMTNFPLTAGSHTLYIGYAKPGALLDKLSVQTATVPPSGLGITAQNICP